MTAPELPNAPEADAVGAPVEQPVRPLPEPDLQADPCSSDGAQTDYYTAWTVRRLLAAERERCAKLCESVASDLENAEEDAQALSTGAQSCADQIRAVA